MTRRRGCGQPTEMTAPDELDRLRAWKESAMVELGAWDEVWEAAGRPGRLGSSKAESTRVEVERLRAERRFAAQRSAQ